MPSSAATHYLYLHGFASSPRSAKAQFLRQQFLTRNCTLHLLDLNQNDFAHLTLTRQIQQVLRWLQDHESTVIIGSSLGGLTAAWVAQQAPANASIERLVLLAPAFQFLDQWLPRLGHEAMARWQADGWLPIYHYGLGQQQLLSKDFWQDAQRYADVALTASIPTLIVHGCRDEVIDISASRHYAANRPWVKLVEVEADHSLADAYWPMWEHIQGFLSLPEQSL